MHQVLFGTGVVAIAAGIIGVLYGALSGHGETMSQSVALFLSGCVFVTLRNIIVKLDELEGALNYRDMSLKQIQVTLDKINQKLQQKD